MSNKSSSAFFGTYDSVEAASTDLEAVGAAHHAGTVGHVEVAVMSRDQVGKLSWDRHEKLGGLHLSHAPSDEMTLLADQVEASSVALVVIAPTDDVAAVEKAAGGSRDHRTQTLEHMGLAEGFYAGSGGSSPVVEETGYEDGSVGHLGV